MNHRMRRIVETQACERRYGIADQKGAEYSGKGSTYKETDADTLANFKNVAERIGGTPEQVLMTYLLKHIDSINTAVREAAQHNPAYVVFNRDPKTVYASGEGIVSRLDDARNYLDLLECLLIDNGHINGPHNPNWDNPRVHECCDECEHPHHVEHSPEDVRREAEEMLRQEMMQEAGLVECIDGVYRPPADKDASVKNPGEVQTPIYAQPAVFDPPAAQPTMDALRYGETGEL